MPNLPKITTEDIKKYLDGILKTSSSSTYDRKLSSLKKFFSWAQKQGYLQENAVEDYLNQRENQIISKVVKAEKLNNQVNKETQPFYSSIQAKLISKFEGKPRIQNFLYKAFYSRPEWYKTYHNISFTRYLHFAILTIFSVGLALGIYNQFSSKTKSTSAYPTSLVTPKRYLSFQGRLTNQYGNPVTGATNITFKLWNHITEATENTCNGGGDENCLWSSQVCSVDPDEDGVFNVLLGTTTGDDFTCASATEITSDVFSENAEVWLGVKVATDNEATPRIQIATVAYALNAETLQGFPIDATGSATKNSVVTMNNGGEIVIGETDPKIKSVSGNFLIQGQTMTLSTPDTSNGSININPDGTGTLNLTFEGTAPGGSADGFINATNANITSGALYYGEVASDASGYDFIQFKSGSSPTEKFAVDSSGNTEMAGDLTISGADIFGTNSESINIGGTDATFLLKRNDTGIVTLTSADDDSTAALTILPGGAAAFTLGGASTTAITLATDGTGNAEVVLPNDSIGVTEINDNGATPTDEYCLTYEETGGYFEWATCGSGDTGTNYWQLNGEVISPYNTTLDLAIGGTASASAKFIVNASTGNVGIGVTSPDDLLDISQTTTSGSALEIIRDLASGSTDSPLLNITQDNAGDDQNAVNIKNDGTGVGLYVNQAGTSQGIYAYSNVDDTANLPLVHILADNPLFDKEALYIGNDGTGVALSINQAGASQGLYLYSNVDSSANQALSAIIADNSTFDKEVLYLQNDGTSYGLSLYNSGTGQAALINQAGTARAFEVYSNVGNTADDTLAKFYADNAAFDQTVLTVVQDGTANIMDLYAGATQAFSVSNLGNVTISGDVAINGGDITSTATTFNFDIGNTGTLNFRDGTNSLVAIKDQGTYSFLNLAGKSDTGDPGTCAEGDIYYNAYDDTISVCHSGNTWEALDGGGSSYWTRVEGNLYPTTEGDTISATSSAGTVATFTTSGTNAAMLLQSTANSVTVDDLLLLQQNGTSTTITDAIDVSDETITNAINIGANTILGTTGTIDFTNFDVDSSGNLTLAGTIDTTLTEGSVVFAGTNGVLSEDNSYFFWDATKNMLGLGTTSPISRLHVATDTTNLTGKAALIIDQYENQDIFTASASGDTKMTLKNDGTLRLYNATSSITNDSGDITIDAASDNISFAGDDLSDIDVVNAGTGIFSSVLQVAHTSAEIYSRLGTTTTSHVGNLTTGSDILISGNLELEGSLFLDGLNISNSAGTGTILFTASPSIGQNALSSSSWLIENTANVGEAALTVNQTKAGDIFTASSSGTPKFTIHNDGSILLATMQTTTNTDEATIYYDTDIDHIYMRGGDDTWHRIALDMTKYASNSAGIINQGYIEVAHNQNTNDIGITGWFYDILSSQWKTISDFTHTIKHSLSNEWNDASSSGVIRTQTRQTNVELKPSVNVGTGKDGAITVSTDTNINNTNLISGRSCADGGDAVNYSVTALTSTTATLSTTPSAGCLAVGDEVLLINLQGINTAMANVGNYETLEIYNISTNTITFTTSKNKNYGNNASDDTNIGTSAGTNQLVMLQRVPHYTNVTVNNGIYFYPSVWNGTKGGVIFFRASGSVTSAGYIYAGQRGHTGGPGGASPNQSHGYNGEGIGYQAVYAGSYNTGGGAAGLYNGSRNGGGGSYGTAGGAGGNGAGLIYGLPDLSKLYLGSGGGGGSSYSDGTGSGYGGAGGNGGGIIYVSANTITVSGNINANGSAGANGVTHGCGGGGGAGGSIRIDTNTATLGTNLIFSTGGTGGTGYNCAQAGNGGLGITAIYYTTSYSGSASSPTPSYTVQPYYPYGLYHSPIVATTNAVYYESLRWEATPSAYGKITFQTRSGNSTDPTDGTWEAWKPYTLDTNYKVLQSGDTDTDWTGTNATVSDGSVTRNVDMFENEDEGTAGNTTKFVNTVAGSGYAEATIDSTNISSYDYLTFWVYATASGNTVKIGIGELDATEQEETVTIDTTSTWQKVYWNLSDIPTGSRDEITLIRITNLNNPWNTIHFDNIRVEKHLTNQDGSVITSTPNNYFQYRIIFSTTNTAYRPSVENVTFAYNNGYKVVQVDNNTVRLYNYTGETQNVRLDVIVFGADLAEWYATNDQSIEAGDVVSITGEKDGYGIPKIRKSSKKGESAILGIISTKAGQELGLESPERRLVGLSGRVPVKIAPDSPSFEAGEFLTASTTYPGMATKAVTAGHVVAKSLENWENGSDVTTVNSFINVSWHDPDIYLTNLGELNIQVATDSNQIAEDKKNNLYEITNLTGEIIKKIGVFANIVAANIKAGAIETKEFTTDSFLAFQGTVDNLIVNSGLVSPTIETNIISPIANSDLIFDLENSATDSATPTYGNLVVKGEDGKKVASIDASGNATISGTLETDEVKTNDLYAGKIFADEIVARNGNFAEITSASQSGITREEIEEMLKEAEENLANLSSFNQDNLASATNSANINDLALENLFVTDTLAASFLSLSDSLTLGNDLVIQTTTNSDGSLLTSSIDTLTAPLQIQSLALAPLEIMAGKFRIETDGNVFIDGNLFIAGAIKSESLTIRPSQEFNESGFGNLLDIQNTEGQSLATIDSSGSAKFNELSVNKVIIAGNTQEGEMETVSGNIETNATAGKAIIPAGVNEITITNPNVTNYTLTYVTPTSSTKNNVLYVKAKDNGYFVVGFSEALDIDVSFNWWVIDITQ